MSDHKSRTAETPEEDPRGESPTTDDELKEASHTAMIRHLDGTPNDELRELIAEYRMDISWIQAGDCDDHMTDDQREGYLEGLVTVCNALEEVLHDE